MGNTIYLDSKDKEQKVFLSRGDVTRIQIENPNNTVVTEIYRSKSQLNDGLGASDDQYDQSFGFDRYISTKGDKNTVMIKSFQPSIPLRKLISENDTDIIRQYNYFPPWLSIWPPENFLKDRGLSVNFSPPSTVTLFCKVFPASKSNNITTLMFIPNNPNLKITKIRSTGNQELGSFREDVNMYFLPEVKSGTKFYLEITCCGLIEHDSMIEIRESDEEGTKTDGPRTGALRVVANSVIRKANLVFVPFEEIDPDNHEITESEEKNTRFQSNIQKFLYYINNKAFNQSLIHFTMEVQPLHSFPDDLIEPNRHNAGVYLTSVNDTYFDGIPQASSDTDVNEEDPETQLDSAIKALYDKISNFYNSEELKEHPNRHGETYNRSYKKDNTDNYSDEYVAYKSKHDTYFLPADQQESITYINSHELKANHIYIFLHMDKSKYTNPKQNLPAYTVLEKHIILIFNDILKEEKLGYISHEIGHALGLRHTFELNKEKLTEPIIARIKNEKDEHSKLQKMIKQFEKNKQGKTVEKDIKVYQKNMEKNLKQLKAYITNKDNKIDKEDSIKKYYRKIFYFFNNINLYGHLCHNLYNNPQSKEDAEKLAIAKAEGIKDSETEKENIINNQVLEKEQSRTQENFMDYDLEKTNKDPNLGGDPEQVSSTFTYKSFYKWQWDKMRKSTHLEDVSLTIDP